MAKLVELHEPFSGQRWGHLTVTGGLANGVITASVASASESPPFAVGRFQGAIPELVRDGSDLHIAYARWAGWGRSASVQLGISPAIPWSIVVHGGVACMRLELASVQLSELSIIGGVSDLTLCLAATGERVPIRISGGISRLTLLRPAGVGVRLQTTGGASKVRLDETSLSSVGGGLTWQTESELAPGYYDVEIRGGSEHLTIARTLPEQHTNGAATHPPLTSPGTQVAL